MTQKTTEDGWTGIQQIWNLESFACVFFVCGFLMFFEGVKEDQRRYKKLPKWQRRSEPLQQESSNNPITSADAIGVGSFAGTLHGAGTTSTGF